MKDLISIAILIATMFVGTVIADKIFVSVREAALKKSSEGLPKLSPFADTLTSKRHNQELKPKRN